jgi:hypothetical protein
MALGPPSQSIKTVFIIVRQPPKRLLTNKFLTYKRIYIRYNYQDYSD